MTPANVENTPSLSLAEGTVRRNILSTLAGNVVFSATQWLITVAIARLGNMAMVGQYALGLAVCIPVFAFTGLQIRAVQATDCLGRYRFRDYLNVRIAGTALALLAVAVATAVMPWRRQTAVVVLAVAGSKAVDAFSDVMYGLFQLHDRLDLIARAMALRGVVGLLALTISMAFFHSVTLALASMTAVWLGCLLLYERPIAVRLHKGWGHEQRSESPLAVSRRLVTLCIPLGFVLLLLSASTSLPRMILERDAGEQTLGIFSAVATMSGAIGLLYSALGQTALPRLARIFADNRIHFRSAMGRMTLAGAAVGGAVLVCSWFWGAPVVTLIYGRHGTVTAELVTGLVAVGVLANISTLLGAGLTAAGRFHAQLAAAMLILAVTTVASFWLIPGWGASGAMYASLAGAGFQLLISGYLCWH